MELRRIQFCSGCGDDSCGGCDCNPQLKSFEQQIKGVQGVQGKQGAQGVAGKNNVLNGSELVDSNGGNQNGVDGSLAGGTTTAFSNAGFDLTTSPTMVATVDNSDIANTKYWARFSNSFLSWFGSSVIPKLLPSAGTAGNLLTSNGSIWTSATPVLERYNTTSNLNSVAILPSLVGNNVTFPCANATSFPAGSALNAYDQSDNANYIQGVVLNNNQISYQVQIKVTNVQGSGTPSGWKIGLGSLTNVPYFSNTVGKGQFLFNDGTNLSWGSSAFPVGAVIPWVGGISSAPPAGWLKADGTPILKVDYPELFELLKNNPIFNPTASTTQCNLPNFIGKVPVGVDPTDTNIDAIGEAYGTKTTTLAAKNLPVNSPYDIYLKTSGAVGYSADTSGSKTIWKDSSFTNSNTPANYTTSNEPNPFKDAEWDLKTNNIAGGQTEDGGQPFTNFQPSIACLYIIKY